MKFRRNRFRALTFNATGVLPFGASPNRLEVNTTLESRLDIASPHRSTQYCICFGVNGYDLEFCIFTTFDTISILQPTRAFLAHPPTQWFTPELEDSTLHEQI